jgi:hypothetical protein
MFDYFRQTETRLTSLFNKDKDLIEEKLGIIILISKNIELDFINQHTDIVQMCMSMTMRQKGWGAINDLHSLNVLGL